MSEKFIIQNKFTFTRNNWIRTVEYFPKRRRIAIGISSTEKGIVILDTENYEVVHEKSWVNNGRPTVYQIMKWKDEESFIAATSDPQIRIYSMNEGYKQLLEINPHERSEKTYRVAQLDDDHFLAMLKMRTGSDKFTNCDLVIYSYTTGKIIKEIDVHCDVKYIVKKFCISKRYGTSFYFGHDLGYDRSIVKLINYNTGMNLTNIGTKTIQSAIFGFDLFAPSNSPWEYLVVGTRRSGLFVYKIDLSLKELEGRKDPKLHADDYKENFADWDTSHKRPKSYVDVRNADPRCVQWSLVYRPKFDKLVNLHVADLYYVCNLRNKYAVIGDAHSTMHVFEFHNDAEEGTKFRFIQSSEIHNGAKSHPVIYKLHLIQGSSSSSTEILSCSGDETVRITEIKGMSLPDDSMVAQEKEDLEERVSFLLNNSEEYAFGFDALMFFGVKTRDIDMKVLKISLL